MKIFKGKPPTEMEEFFHNKRMDDLKINIKKMTIIAVIAFVAFSGLIFLSPEKHPNDGAVKVWLMGGAAIVSMMGFAVGISYCARHMASKIWQWRKNSL